MLVIPESRLESLGKFSGFKPFSAEAFKALLNPDYMEFRPRSAVEDDPTFKQLIPYAVLETEVAGLTSVFQYTRGKGQGESRLHAHKSVGIGGHISEDDVAGSGDLYQTGMLRELHEEMEIGCDFEDKIAGFIYDDSNAVGRVHLGVVHTLKLENMDAKAREDGLELSGFAPVNRLKLNLSEFENWSQLCITQLY